MPVCTTRPSLISDFNRNKCILEKVEALLFGVSKARSLPDGRKLCKSAQSISKQFPSEGDPAIFANSSKSVFLFYR